MGLPIWREPDEEQAVQVKHNVSWTPQPHSIDRVRSSRIRRRPSIHGLRGRNRGDQRDRQLSQAPRLERSQTLAQYPSNMPRSLRDGIPPISSLLETAESTISPLSPYPMLQTGRGMGALPRPTRDADWSTTELSEGSRLRERQRLIASTNRIVTRLLGEVENVSLYAEAERSDVQVGEILQSPLTESPEPLRAHLVEDSSTAISLGASLPTPPLDNPTEPTQLPALQWWSESHTRMLAESARAAEAAASVRTEPDGLGDRERSPMPDDDWEVMRSTIAPDATLPSVDSSFTSVAVSQSFSRSTTSTAVTDTGAQPIHPHSTDNTSNHDDVESVSSVGSDDLCADEESFLERSETMALDMYYKDMQTPEGRERIAEHEGLRNRDGNRWGLRAEAAAVDIGYRLIEAAVARVETSQADSGTGPHHTSRIASNPDLLRLAEITRGNRGRRQRHQIRAHAQAYPSHDTESSLEAPIAHSVGEVVRVTHNGIEPVGAHLESSGSLLSSLLADSERRTADMRRVAERLANQDDVPDEWWMSMGLRLPHTRPRRLRHAGHGSSRDRRVHTELARVRAGRVEGTRERESDRDGRGSRL